MAGLPAAASYSRDRLTQADHEELLARARAARELVRTGAIDGWLALSLVIDPPASLTGRSPTRKRRVEAEELAEVVRLAAEGLSERQIAARMRRSRWTVSRALRAARVPETG
jgi:DNA-binding NarL/FixJ family response regulator